MRIEDFILARLEGLTTEFAEPLRQTVYFHKNWPVLVETPPKLEAIKTDMNDLRLQMTQQIAWTTNEKYREQFGSEPPTAPILAYFASVWYSHPDFDPEWLRGIS